MKKTLALFMLLVLAVASFAQEKTESSKPDAAEAMKMKFGAKAGLNFSSMEMKYSGFGKIDWKDGNSSQKFKSITGFHVGGAANIPLSLLDLAGDSYLLGVAPGVQFIKKGGQYKGYTGSLLAGYYSTKYTVDAYYVEVPVPVTFKKWFSKDLSASLEAGPYFAFGLFGEQKFVGGPWDYKQSSFDDGLGRFDMGIISGVSADYSNFYGAVMLGSGMTENVTSSFYLTLGYKF